MRSKINIGVFLPLSTAFGRNLLAGVRGFASRHPSWHLLVGDAGGRPPAQELAGENIIGFFGSDTWLEFGSRARSAVNVSGRLDDARIASVVSDGEAVGCMAAEHFLHHGFRRFGFVGTMSPAFGRDRSTGFVRRLEVAGFGSRHFDHPEDRRLLKIETPAALFAVNDHTARQLIVHLSECGREVPKDFAVLGVDDDPLESLLSPVAISSVVPNAEKIGFEAAKMLRLQMQGIKPAKRRIRIAPIEVIARRSTDRFTSNHPAAAKALRLIQEDAAGLMSVEEVARGSQVSRRLLDRLFREELNETVHTALCRAKLEVALPHVIHGQKTMAEIGALAGFTDARLFNNVCRRLTGKTPGSLRREAAL